MRLTEEQLVRFKTDGCLVLHGLLDEELMAKARSRVWEFLPEGMDRSDRTTWAGPFTEAQTEGSRKGFHGLFENCRSGYIWKDRQAGASADILALVEQVMPIAEQLLGIGQVHVAVEGPREPAGPDRPLVLAGAAAHGAGHGRILRSRRRHRRGHARTHQQRE